MCIYCTCFVLSLIGGTHSFHSYIQKMNKRREHRTLEKLPYMYNVYISTTIHTILNFYWCSFSSSTHYLQRNACSANTCNVYWKQSQLYSLFSLFVDGSPLFDIIALVTKYTYTSAIMCLPWFDFKWKRWTSTYNVRKIWGKQRKKHVSTIQFKSTTIFHTSNIYTTTQ